MAKRRRESLPDLRRKGYTYPESPDASGWVATPPSADAIARLSVRHGIPSQVDLRKEIVEIWFWWRADAATGRPARRSQQKEFLTTLTALAGDLNDALTKAGIEERKLLADSMVRPVDLDVLAHSCHNLRLAGIIAKEKVPRGHGGRRGDTPFINLVAKLFRLWQRAFEAKAARIAKSETYGGRFFSFVKDVTALFGIRKSNDAIGKTIEKAIKAVDRRKPRKMSIPKIDKK